MEVQIHGAKSDLHSGHWGGTVHNPAQAIAEIINKLHNDDGSVAVPHFYDDVDAIDDEEREILLSIEDDINKEWQDVVGAPQQWGEPDYSLHERIGARPTLEINGLSSGYTGEGHKMVLPQKAIMKISCRLVPHQDPATIAKMVQEYIIRIAPPSVKVDFDNIDATAPAALLKLGDAAIEAASKAYTKGWGVEPVFGRAGGSIPITFAFMDVVDDITIMGFSYKGGRAHGQNENIYLDMFYKGIDTAIYFLQEIATS